MILLKYKSAFLFLFLIAIFSLNVASCKSKKEVVQPIDDTMANVENKIEKVNDRYDLVLSFYSIGSGSDWDVIAEFDRFIEFNKSTASQQPVIERIPWGREGEVDFCIDLTMLSTNEKAAFLEKSKEITQKAKYVHVNENAPCRNKR